MSNLILDIAIENRSLDPASAEVWVTVELAPHAPAPEIRGKLMGPHCPYASTIEVAYPLRPVRPDQEVPGATRLRASVPEPSLWDPQSPFLYTVLLEFWRDGQRHQQERLSHGLRTIALSPKGIVVNGKVFRPKGQGVTEQMRPDQATALRLRQEGYNLLVAPVTEPAWWDLADVYGFLMLGLVSEDHMASVAELEELAQHPSALAWLARPEVTNVPEGTRRAHLSHGYFSTGMVSEPTLFVGPAKGGRVGEQSGGVLWLLRPGDAEAVELGAIQ